MLRFIRESDLFKVDILGHYMVIGRPGMANRQYYYNGFGALRKEYVLEAEIDFMN